MFFSYEDELKFKHNVEKVRVFQEDAIKSILKMKEDYIMANSPEYIDWLKSFLKDNELLVFSTYRDLAFFNKRATEEDLKKIGLIYNFYFILRGKAKNQKIKPQINQYVNREKEESILFFKIQNDNYLLTSYTHFSEKEIGDFDVKIEPLKALPFSISKRKKYVVW